MALKFEFLGLKIFIKGQVYVNAIVYKVFNYPMSWVRMPSMLPHAEKNNEIQRAKKEIHN